MLDDEIQMMQQQRQVDALTTYLRIMKVNAGVELKGVVDEDAILTIQVQATKSRY